MLILRGSQVDLVGRPSRSNAEAARLVHGGLLRVARRAQTPAVVGVVGVKAEALQLSPAARVVVRMLRPTPPTHLADRVASEDLGPELRLVLVVVATLGGRAASSVGRPFTRVAA